MDEKKNIKRLNKKLFIALILVCVILSTALAIKAFALKVKFIGVSVNTTEGTITGVDVYYWDGSDLHEKWYIFCCQHNVQLPSNTNRGTGYEAWEYHYSANGNLYVLDARTDTKGVVVTTNSTASVFTYHETFVYNEFTDPEQYITDPVESYILSTSAGKVTYGTNYQRSWWCTYIGTVLRNGGTGDFSNTLYKEATSFHEYVLDVLGVDDTEYNRNINYYDDSVTKLKGYPSPINSGGVYATGDEESTLYWREYNLEDENGTSITVVAPNLQDYFNPTIRYYIEGEELETEEDQERADVNFNDVGGEESEELQVYFEEETNSWIVGPFSMEYPENSGEITVSKNDLESSVSTYTAALNLAINGISSYVSSFQSGYGEYQNLLYQYNIEADEKTKDDLKYEMEQLEASLLSQLNTIISNTETILSATESVTFGNMDDLVSELSSLKSSGLIVNIEAIINDLQLLSDEFTTNSADLQQLIQNYIDELNEQIDEVEESGTETEDGSDIVYTYSNAYSYIDGATLETNLGEAEYDETTGWGVSSDGSFRWTFRWVANERSEDDTDSLYPHSKEVFYIQIEYSSNGLLTQFKNLSFDFKYMNAGGLFEIYYGKSYTTTWVEKYKPVKYYYDVYTREDDGEGGYTSWTYSTSTSSSSALSSSTYKDYRLTSTEYEHWIELESANGGQNCQNLGVVVKAARWYESKTISLNAEWEFEEESTIVIEKTTSNKQGELVETNDSFIFDVYVDYTGTLSTVDQWKALSASELANYGYSSVTVTTTNGKGTKTLSGIMWETDDAGNLIQPTYYVVEREKDGYEVDGPWAGKLLPSDGSPNKVTIEAINVPDEHKGKIKVVKQIANDEFNILSNEEFSFTLAISGEFEYKGVSYACSAANPLEIDFTITGAGTWELDDYIYWYGDTAPYYQVVENDNSDYYECTYSSNTKGYIKCEECGYDEVEVTFVNETTVDYTKIKIDKSLVSGTAPQSGEEFKVKLIINAASNGTFQYGSNYDTTKAADLEKYELEITLNESNNWTWESDYIWWTTTKAPTYTVEEVEMADHTEFYSITDTSKTSTNSVFESTLKEIETTVTITNEDEASDEGKLKLIKLSDDGDSSSYTFKVTISGYFEGTINGTTYAYGDYSGDNAITFEVDVTANTEAQIVAELKWYESDYTGTTKAPTYTVEEVDNDNFVSISNGSTSSTSSSSINGYFVSGDTDTVIVTCINTTDDESEPNSGTISINKSVIGIDNLPDDLVVTVKLTIKSQTNETFQYSDTTTYDNSSTAINYSTYVFSDDPDDNPTVAAIELNKGNNWTWNSKNILWKDTEHAPYYTVSEVSISGVDEDDYEFYRTVTQTGTLTTSKTGSIQLVEGTNHIEFINQYVGGDELYGQLKIQKVAYNDEAGIVAGDKFNFTVKVTGTFTYNDTQYTNETLTLNVEDVEAGGDAWISGTFSWNENDDTPTYQIIENLTDEQIANGVTFEGMYSSSNAKTSNVQDWLAGDLVGSDDPDNIATATVTARNGSETHYGRIEIKKVVEDQSGNAYTDLDMTFEFTITVELNGNIRTLYATLSGGQTYISDYIEWSGSDNPRFMIEEATGDYSTSFTVNGSTYTTGVWVDLECMRHDGTDAQMSVIATNTLTEHEGYISVKKVVEDSDKVSSADSSENATDTFTIRVTISSTGTFVYNGVAYTNDSLTLKIYLKDGEEWQGTVKWFGDDVPDVTVEETESEMPANYYYLVGISTNSDDGKLIENGTVTSVVTNSYYVDNKSYLTTEMGGKVWDDTESDKVSEADGGSAENGLLDEDEPGIEGVKVTISRAIVTSDGTLYKKLSGVYAYDDSYELITAGTDDWYVDANGDIYTYTDSDGNWYIDKISVAALVGDEQDTYLSLLQADSNGNYAYRVAYYVTFSYDGQTYEPTTYMATSNTTKAYDTSTIKSLAKDYTDLSISAKDNYLLNSFAIDIGTTGNDSATSSDTRTAFNNKFATILGDEVMNESGDTTGTTSGNITLKYSSVDSISTYNSDNTKKVSTLLTAAEDYGETPEANNQVYSAFQIDASTIEAYLAYPCSNNINLSNTTLENQWLIKNDSSSSTLYTVYRKYHAVYNYMKSINLGLIQRETADVSTEKDLTEMIVVVNGKVITYKYNSLIDFESDKYSDYLLQQLADADAEVTYTLGLYSSDYYYRGAIYEGSEAGDAITNTLGIDLDSLDLQVYLKYTITVYNESDSYDVSIEGLDDYHDESLILIDSSNMADTSTYISSINGEEVNKTMTLEEMLSGSDLSDPDDGLATAYSTIVYYDKNGNAENANKLDSITWSQDANAIAGSDEVNYYKMSTTSMSGRKITAGGKAKIQLTYKVDKDTDDSTGYSIDDCIVLGTKHNIVEVSSFSDYYSDTSTKKWGQSVGSVAGKVDEDSAPGNVNIEKLNELNYYEDDTTEAPMAYITVVDIDREINGLVWEDAETETIAYSQTIGNGIYNLDEGDTLIEGMTTQLVEVISVPVGTDSNGNTIYEEYDFIWDTDETYSWLGGSTLSELTGFNSSTTTNSMGEYEFTGVSAGNYKVRFVYGDTKVLTGNEDYEVVYNGQDYKSTTYQAGFTSTTDSDDNGYTDNAWQDLSDASLEAARVSDARDSEARRVYITSKSEMLTYENTSVLSTADDDIDTSDGSGDEDYYDELFGYGYDSDGNKISGYEAALLQNDAVTGGDLDDDGVDGSTGYYMYAETAKIDLEIENVNDLDGSSTNINGINTVTGTSVMGQTTVTNYTYTIDNIDFGVEERSQTKLTLDKQIKEITITTSDNQVILDAVYDIIYEVGSDGSINVTVKLNELESTGYDNIASLNRSNSNQGYRYVMIDSTILQGTTLTVLYQLTVFNVSEADTSSTLLANIWEEMEAADTEDEANEILNKVLEELTSNRYTSTTRLAYDPETDTYGGTYEYGKYVGSIYYLGTDGTYFLNETDTYGGYTMLAETTVHQIIDYIDPDIEFIDTNNISTDQSWTTTTIDYLLENNLIDPNAVILLDADGLPVYEVVDREIVIKTYADIADLGTSGYDSYTILNDELQQFITEYSKNIVLNIDNGDETDSNGETLTAGNNPSLVKATVPYTAYYQYDADYAYETILDKDTNTYSTTAINGDDYSEDTEKEYAYDNSTAQITLTVSRYYSSEDDGQDVDNIAEIIKVENTVGRRDSRNVAGNTITYQIDQDEASQYSDPEYILTSTVSLYQIAAEEPDTSATEVITLSPPTGLNSITSITLKVLAIILVALVITLIGIIIIKKKVLLKK